MQAQDHPNWQQTRSPTETWQIGRPRTIGTIQEELSRAIARADYAESLVKQADERASKAEAARARSSSALIAVALLPGIRGHLGRWLVKLRLPSSEGPVGSNMASQQRCGTLPVRHGMATAILLAAARSSCNALGRSIRISI